MTRPRENPLFPASLAANGIQGAGANTQASAYGAEHSPQQDPQEAAALILALTATDAARGQLSRYAGMTDAPACGIVEAADLLDAARVMLARVATP